VVGVEHHRVNLDTKGSNILLLELSGEMSLHECGLSDSTITDKDELELTNNLGLSFHNYKI
jgi:hypothetical protein